MLVKNQQTIDASSEVGKWFAILLTVIVVFVVVWKIYKIIKKKLRN